MFSEWEDWNMLDGSYFCFVSLSTIGFGDIVPGDKIYAAQGLDLSFIFCSMYLMLGEWRPIFTLLSDLTFNVSSSLQRSIFRPSLFPFLPLIFNEMRSLSLPNNFPSFFLIIYPLKISFRIRTSNKNNIMFLILRILKFFCLFYREKKKIKIFEVISPRNKASCAKIPFHTSDLFSHEESPLFLPL